VKNKIPEWGPRHPNWNKTNDFPPVDRNIKAIRLVVSVEANAPIGSGAESDADLGYFVGT
jgi:hypothetical protein